MFHYAAIGIVHPYSPVVRLGRVVNVAPSPPLFTRLRVIIFFGRTTALITVVTDPRFHKDLVMLSAEVPVPLAQRGNRDTGCPRVA